MALRASTPVKSSGRPPTSSALGYRPELDGLRAFAVVAVILGHFVTHNRFTPAGGLGVDLFFVLSGFLITRLLLEEISRSGRADLRSFYIRRSARLFPAMYLLCAVVVVEALTINVLDVRSHALYAALAAGLYVGNWYRAFGHDTSALGHTWSLAVEEQFYFVWPIVMLVAHRLRGVAGVRLVAIVLFLASMVDMIVRSKMGTSIDVLYNSTDTHGALMLMIGCFLATVVITDDPLATPFIGPASKYLALPATMVAAALLTTTGPRWRYEGGYVLIAMAFALLVVRALQRDHLTASLTAKPLVWIGQRSYGLYLWHYPIGAFVRSEMNPDWMPAGVHRVVAVVISVIVAALSYRYFEQPIRKRVVSRASRPTTGDLDAPVIDVTDSAMAAAGTTSSLPAMSWSPPWPPPDPGTELSPSEDRWHVRV